MTCVVGIKKGGVIYMGADSAYTSDNQIIPINNPKIFRLGDLIVGFAGDCQVGQSVRYRMKLRKRRKSEEAFSYIVSGFVPAAHQACDEFKVDSFDLIVGICGRLFEIYTDWSVGESSTGFSAIGSGAQVALGALSVLPESMAPNKRLKLALEASAKYCPGVRGPFIFEDTRNG